MYNNFRFVGTQIWNYIIDHLDIKVSLPKEILIKNYSRHTFNQTIITSSYDNIIEANYFTFYYILLILFVSIISLINIINSSILQQIISSFPDKYVTLSVIYFFPIVAIIHVSKSMYILVADAGFVCTFMSRPKLFKNYLIEGH